MLVYSQELCVSVGGMGAKKHNFGLLESSTRSFAR